MFEWWFQRGNTDSTEAGFDMSSAATRSAVSTDNHSNLPIAQSSVPNDETFKKDNLADSPTTSNRIRGKEIADILPSGLVVPSMKPCELTSASEGERPQHLYEEMEQESELTNGVRNLSVDEDDGKIRMPWGT